ncbi:MAG: gamma-glutamylcyclotransferase family protein [Bacillota bacterium]|nr:gamma-glutamylcyclotransferase family protein [Bacillota bacterium]
MSKYYLAYGSNLNLAQMRRRCPNAKQLGGTILHGYELFFNRYLGIREAEGKSLPLGVWEINEDDEARLDVYEGYPELYSKSELEVEFSGKRIIALIYFMNEEKPFAPPTASYLEGCRQGYRDFGFEQKYLDEALGVKS